MILRSKIRLARSKLLHSDEPVTGLDAIIEARLHEALHRLKQGKTTFLIAHRLSSMKKSDLILLIEKGKVIEQGTHEELLATSSLYGHLYNIQYEQSEPATRPEGGAS